LRRRPSVDAAAAVASGETQSAGLS
jgi:hypothetical protein